VLKRYDPQAAIQVRNGKSQRLRETLGSSMMKSREILTPSQSTQEALDTERYRYRSLCCLKEPDSLEKQGPTSDAVAVLRSEDRRRKVNYHRGRKGL
jgi:hypothetical protein